MTYIELVNTIEGSKQRSASNAGAPVGGTDEVQELSVTGAPTGGTYRLKFAGRLTAALDYDATDAEVQAALEALPNIGEDNVTVADTEGDYPYTITFVADMGKMAQPLIEAVYVELTGGTDPDVEITEDTPGVNATGRGMATGTMLTDSTTGKVYVNTGTPTAPTWTVVGSQTA